MMLTAAVAKYDRYNPQTDLTSTDQTTTIVATETRGKGPNARKFLFGVACGAGAIATVAGYAGGIFTGGLSAAITGITLMSATAAVCAEVAS